MLDAINSVTQAVFAYQHHHDGSDKNFTNKEMGYFICY